MKTRLYLHNLDSTKLEYEKLAELGAAADSWIVRAGGQKSGMGRDGNSWHSPLGGLWLSFDLIHPASVASFPLYVGFCLWELLSDIFALQELKVKWPNDLFLDGKKLAGILCSYQQNNSKYLIGIGINTNVALDEQLRFHDAASLCQSLGMPVSNEILAHLIVNRVEKNSHLLHEPEHYLSQCAKVLYGLGKQAVAMMGQNTVSGVISGLSSEGFLLLRAGGGEMQQISHGTLRLKPVTPHQAFS